MCCNAGAVQLPALGPTPAVLADLLLNFAQTGGSGERAFRENVRRYNVSLAMASSLMKSGSRGWYAESLLKAKQ